MDALFVLLWTICGFVVWAVVVLMSLGFAVFAWIVITYIFCDVKGSATARNNNASTNHGK